MRRRLPGLVTLAVIAAVAAGGCDDNERTGPPRGEPATSLHIVLFPNGRDAPKRQEWDVRCDPIGGTLPEPAGACASLARTDDPFAPVPPETVCTEIFGGYQILEITGRLRAKTVRAVFSRTDGCQIAAFDRVAKTLGLADEVRSP